MTKISPLFKLVRYAETFSIHTNSLSYLKKVLAKLEAEPQSVVRDFGIHQAKLSIAMAENHDEQAFAELGNSEVMFAMVKDPEGKLYFKIPGR